MTQKTKKLLGSFLAFTLAISPFNCADISVQAEVKKPSTTALNQDPLSFSTGNASENAALDAENSSVNPQISTNYNLIGYGKSILKGSSSSVSPYTSTTYYHEDSKDGMNIYHGIDVSYHQATIDWTKVKAAGIDFAIIRMGYRGYTNGTLFTDTTFAQNMQGAIDAGIKVGAYFFTEAINEAEAVEEAQYMVKALEPYRANITMPIAIDWEKNGASPSGGRKFNNNLTKDINTAVCTAFCDTISTNGYTPCIYANKSDFSVYLDCPTLSSKFEIWLARYNTSVNVTSDKEKYTNPYTIWQYSSKGKVDGITTGNTDMNFWYTNSTINSPSFTHSSTNAALSAQPEKDVDEVTELKNVKNFFGKPTKKNITLSWEKVKDAEGYQIYRKDAYNGSYKKITTITDSETESWKDNNLPANHEYYYKIRAYLTQSDGILYSEYTFLTAATKVSNRCGILKKTVRLGKKPAKKPASYITIKKGMPLTFVGTTHMKNGKQYLHFQHVTKAKTYNGYLTVAPSIKYYTTKATTASLNFRKTAGMSGAKITAIPKGTYLPKLGTKKVSGTEWIRTCFCTKKGVLSYGYVASSYLK